MRHVSHTSSSEAAMKVTHVTTRVLRTPADNPLVVGRPAPTDTREFVTHLPVVSHRLPEIHVHLVAAVPHGLTVEYMPWTLRRYEEAPSIENGKLVVPKRGGLGLGFDPAAMKRYQVS
jgi:hypothetical protein